VARKRTLATAWRRLLPGNEARYRLVDLTSVGSIVDLRTDVIAKGGIRVGKLYRPAIAEMNPASCHPPSQCLSFSPDRTAMTIVLRSPLSVREEKEAGVLYEYDYLKILQISSDRSLVIGQWENTDC